MRYSEIITEAPQLIPPTDFNMSDNSVRYQYTRSLLGTYPQEVLEDAPTYKLVRVGSGSVVTFFMLQKPDDLLVYFVKCESGTVAFLGQVATQVSLWRDADSVAVQGITRKVFSLLVKTYGTILSDEQQTDYGRTFWRQRMAEAVAAGLRVGLADMKNKVVDWYDPAVAYMMWAKEHEHAWSTDESAQSLRFVISNQR